MRGSGRAAAGRISADRAERCPLGRRAIGGLILAAMLGGVAPAMAQSQPQPAPPSRATPFLPTERGHAPLQFERGDIWSEVRSWTARPGATNRRPAAGGETRRRGAAPAPTAPGRTTRGGASGR